MKHIIVIPTYNEAKNLPEMVGALFTLPLEDVNIIIVDDNSPDGTGDIADKLCQEHSGMMSVVHRPGKMGLGSAYAQGFQVALGMGADIVIQMDADFSHSPDYLPEMVRHLDEYDVVVGSRFIEGGGTDERWSWWRFLLSWWANQVYTRLILGVPVKDATAGFKAWRRQTLAAIDFDRVVSNGYVFQVEMAFLCHKLGFRTFELPIYFEDRRIGQSKMDVPIKVEAVWRVWQIRWRYRRVRPQLTV